MFTQVNIEILVMSNNTTELGSEQNISETINEFPYLPVTLYFLFVTSIFIALIMALFSSYPDDIPDDEDNNNYLMEEDMENVIVETNPAGQTEAGPGPGPGLILNTTTPPSPPPPPQPSTQSMMP